ncbi:MAG: type II toxin-antitoxin system RelE/ParE family toxin [Desulfobacterales bacterium]
MRGEKKDRKRDRRIILDVPIVYGIEEISNDLKGDVKRLTNFTPEYRLRVGDYRILFETYKDKITIYRILHRKDVYK